MNGSSPRVPLSQRTLTFVCFALFGLGQLGFFWFGLYKVLLGAFALAALLCLSIRPPRVSGRSVVFGALALLFALYAYVLMSSRWAPVPSESLAAGLNAIAAAGIPFVFGFMVAKRVSATAIGTGLAILPWIFLTQIAYNLIGGIDPVQVGEFTMRTYLGGLTCFMTPILLGCFLSTRSLWVLAACVASLALAMSIQSRAATLIVPLSLLMVLRLYNWRSVLLALASMLVIALAIGAATGGEAYERFSGSGTKIDISSSILDELEAPPEEQVDLDRRLHGLVALDLLLQHPIFGAGYWSVWHTHMRDFGRDISAHGLIPGTMAEIGIVGLSIFIAFIWAAARVNLQLSRTDLNVRERLQKNAFLISAGAVVAFGLFHQSIETALFGVSYGLLLGSAVRLNTLAASRRGHAVIRQPLKTGTQ